MRTFSLIAAVALAAGSSGSTFAATAVHPTVAPAVSHAPTIAAPKATPTKASTAPTATPKPTPAGGARYSATFPSGATSWLNYSNDANLRQVTLTRHVGDPGTLPKVTTELNKVTIVGNGQTVTLTSAVVESISTHNGINVLVMRYTKIEITK